MNNTNTVNVINGSSLNTVSAGITAATIAGGGATITSTNYPNSVIGNYGAVGGGIANTSAGYSVVGGGFNNFAGGFIATVAGGANNAATGDFSFAAGRRAKTQSAGAVIHNGTFAFADSTDIDFNTSVANEFAVRATGGVRFVSAVDITGIPTAGVKLAAGGGSWSSLSDRAAKRDLSGVDTLAILAKLVGMPVYTWRYRAESSGAMHMGPVAQDFQTAFGLGDSDRHITTVDADGVALAAIQGLYQLILEKDRKIQRLEADATRVDTLERELATIKARMGLQ